MGRLAVAVALLLAGAGAARAQLATSLVSGLVVAPDGRPAPGVQVALLDPLGHPLRAVTADAAGRFRMLGVASGRYQIEAAAPPLRSGPRRIAVADGLAVDVRLELVARLSEDVAVVEATDSSATSGTILGGDAVRRAGAPLRSNALRLAVSTAPGWTSEDNGLLHYRGTDDGALYVLDGVPVYERLDPQAGVAPDPAMLGSVRIVSGYVPAEFGLRSGGVIEVRSRFEEGRSWSGAVEGGVGGNRTEGADALAQGPLGSHTSLTLTGSGERSHRFLDPVSLENRHNEGSTASGAAEIVWTPERSVVLFRAGHGGSSFEVPFDEPQATGPTERLTQTFVTLNGQRSWSTDTVAQLAVFGRFTRAHLHGHESDAPLFAEADREQDRLGLLAAVTHERGRHRIKAGLEASGIRLQEHFRFAVTGGDEDEDADFSDAALAHGLDNPFDFAGRATRAIASLYVQDSWRTTDRLTLEAGVRYDRSRLLLAESALSPRLGASYRAGPATFRASVNRFFQPPQTEFLLLSSSAEARELSPFADELGGGGGDVHAERQTAAEGGVELRLGNALRADVAVWQRWIRNQADPNVFFGTTIVFPNSVARGRAQGLDVRLEMPRRRGFSAFLTYTLAKVEQFGPIDGGLFLDDDIIDVRDGTRFIPDHDQRHAVSTELGYENAATGSWVAVSGRYRTGTPIEVPEEALAGLVEREGGDLVDLTTARVKPYTVVDLQAGQRLLKRDQLEVSARASLLNAAGARYAFNFGNPFSGTHFGAPRSLRVDLRVALR